MHDQQNSYEAPSLVKVGEAHETILGSYMQGFDGDGLFLGSVGQEFQSELGPQS
jgi:hypothetical protein